MAVMLPLALVSLFFTGVSMHQQYKAGQRARDLAEEQKKEQQASRRLAEIRNRRARIEEMRKERIMRASIQSQSFASNTEGSSGSLGGQAAVRSQAVSNMGFLNQVEQTSQTIFDSRMTQTNIGADMSQRQAYAGIAGTIGSVFSPAIVPAFKDMKTS